MKKFKRAIVLALAFGLLWSMSYSQSKVTSAFEGTVVDDTGARGLHFQEFRLNSLLPT
jgi:hypothetical protein